jgi:hypothetical protein
VRDGAGDVDHVRELHRLAVVEGLDLRQLLAVLLHQVGESVHQEAALRRRCRAPRPGLERPPRGRDGRIDIGGSPVGDRGDRLSGGRVEGVERPAVGGGTPLAADHEVVRAGDEGARRV